MQLALLLPPIRDRRWNLAKQLGVEHAVTRLPRTAGVARWDYTSLLHLRHQFEDQGIALDVIEESPPLDGARLGLPHGKQQTEDFIAFIQNAGAVGVRMICWNWMACFNWLRTSVSVPVRGGALATAYRQDVMRDAPLTEYGRVSDAQLWDTLADFLTKVVPAATEAGVTLALHPDDPPVPVIRGIARIIRSPEAIERMLELYPSPYHSLAFCQGTIAEMGCGIPATIRRFAHHIAFVHFRDVRGTADNFVESFHDDGQTDMWEAMRTYHDFGIDVPMRPDHVPTMDGETNDDPGYEFLGRLFAIGYMRGLQEASVKTSQCLHPDAYHRNTSD